MRCALLISGHLRFFQRENIVSHLLVPLLEQNIDVDIFISVWDEHGDRHRPGEWNTNLSPDVIASVLSLKPRHIDIEQGCRELFTNTYQTSIVHKYSCHETYGDGVSMWYKIFKAFQNMELYEKIDNRKYDVVIRHRPDILLSLPINVTDIIRSVTKKCVLIPSSHGKYFDVTYGLMDQIFFGDRDEMEKICKSFLKVHPKDLAHIRYFTAEGIMQNSIIANNVNIERIDINYSVHRGTSIEKVV